MKLPQDDILGITAVLLTCLYGDKVPPPPPPRLLPPLGRHAFLSCQADR